MYSVAYQPVDGFIIHTRQAPLASVLRRDVELRPARLGAHDGKDTRTPPTSNRSHSEK